MARASNLVEDFYEFYKESTTLDSGDFFRVCRAPFRHIKEEFSKGSLKPFRLQYLGTFSIPAHRVKYSLKCIEEKFNNGLMSEKKYLERKELLERYEKEDHT